MSDIYFTSDLHIGHKHVASIRGFDTAEHIDFGIYETGPDTDAHDEWLAANWDATVRPQDQVFVLGDISINGGQHALDWIASRPGTKHLISGNHDPVHPGHRTAAKKLPHWGQYFETIQPFMRRKLMGTNILLSHFPYASFGDGEGREGSRFDQYRLPDMGELLLHGHTHGTERDHDSMFHVGVDAWGGMLVPQDTIINWIASKKESAV